jgi:putative membrane protein
VQAIAVVFAVIAALIHVYIFVLESIRWTAPSTRRTFGTTAQTAEITKPLAFNQGFYNLFLAIVAAVGVVLMVAGSVAAARALIFAGAGSMLAASLVLAISDPGKLRAAAVQGTAPLLAVIFLAISLTTS